MRKSIQLVVALAVIAMVAVSCQKEGQFNPSKKVKTITTTSVSSVAGLESTKTSKMEFVWDGNKLSSVNAYTDGEVAAVSKYSYDSKNRVTEIVTASPNDYSYTYKYVYDGNKLCTINVGVEGVNYGSWKVIHDGNYITEIQYQASESKGSHLSVPVANALYFLPESVIEGIDAAVKDNMTKGLARSSVYFSWENGNLIGYSYAASGATYETKLEYDGKKNPVYGWYDFDLSSIDVMFSKHNITKQTTTVKAGEQSLTNAVTFIYKYSGSYPTSCEWTKEQNYMGQTFSVKSTQEFVY